MLLATMFARFTKQTIYGYEMLTKISTQVGLDPACWHEIEFQNGSWSLTFSSYPNQQHIKVETFLSEKTNLLC